MRQQPVPNQPVFTWQPTFSVINLRGSVLGDSGLVPCYGKVIAGTQQICNVAVVYKGIRKASRFYAHGFHLPVSSIAGSTRYRFPILVRIWNVVMTGINVIARVEGYTGSMNVMATASHSTGEVNQTFLHIGGIEKDDWIKLCFTATGITRVLYAMYNCIEVPKKKIQLIISEIGKVSGRLLRMSVTTSQKVARRLQLVTWVHYVQHLRHKIQVGVWNSKLLKMFKMKAAVADPDIETTAKMGAEIAAPDIPLTGKLMVRPLPVKVDHIGFLKVRLLGLDLKGIMSYIKYGLKLQKMWQYLNLRTEATEYKTHIQGTVTTEVKQIDTRVSVLYELSQWVTSKFQVAIRACKTMASSLLHMHLWHTKMSSHISMDTSSMIIERKMDLLARLESYQGKVALLAHVEEVRDFLLDLQVYLISVLGETSLKFRPQALPQVRRLNVMISVCETWVLSYLSFIPTEVFQGVEVHISTCSHTVRRILQWYLAGGRISNQGYGNEIIFDLGKVDPTGPIPPIPSQKWEGGYVEDPFRGVGYVPKDDTTGYASPKVDDWLGNVKMYWEEPSQPFDGGKKEEP